MDSTLAATQALVATLSLSGNSAPHKLAEALSVILPLLPLDVRARAACVCRAWRAAAANPELWEELSFERCAARVSDETLASLCVRAGAALRTLRLDVKACETVTARGMLAALRGGGCTGVQRLWAPVKPPCSSWRFSYRNKQELAATAAIRLAAACPMLQHAACSVRCYRSDVARVSSALPGPLTLFIESSDSAHDAISWMDMVECLRVNNALKSLDLKWSRIGDTGTTQLAECLRTNIALTSLNLKSNDIGDAGAMQLADCLRVNSVLTSLNLGSNNISAEGAMQLAECLRVNTTLANLDLSRSRIGEGIGEGGVAQLAECLRVNTALTSLDLKSCNISAGDAMQLADRLRVNTVLTSLGLGLNEIGDEGATQLGKCLRVNNTLTSLDLGFNHIGNTGATQLVKYLHGNTALTSLGLCGNRIGIAGVMQLAECLRENSALTSLDLSNNDIHYGDCDRVFKAMLTLLEFPACIYDHGTNRKLAVAECRRLDSSTLITIIFGHRDEPSDTMIWISKGSLLFEHTTVTSLDLNPTHYEYYENTGSGCELDEIAYILRTNTTLTSLDLSENSISDEGAAIMANCMRVNATLTCLNLASNLIGDEGATALAECLRVNTSLTSVAPPSDIGDLCIGRHRSPA